MGIQSIYNANYFNNSNIYQNYGNYSSQNSSNSITSIFSLLISALLGQNSNSSLTGYNANGSIFGNNSVYPGVNINNTGNIGNINIKDILAELLGNNTQTSTTTTDQTPVTVDQTTVEVAPKTPQEMTDEELRVAWESAGSVPNDECGTELHNRGLSDPYEVNIDGKKFMFVKDTNNNGKTDGKQEILGSNDTKENLFADMKLLDTDKDGKVSAEELKAANVSLNEVLNGELTVNKFDIDKIDKLDLSSFNSVNNKNTTGTFGTFSLQLKNGDIVEGTETFEDQKYFDKLIKI